MDRKGLLVKGIEVGGAFVALLLIILWMAGSFSHKIEPGVVAAQSKIAPADAATARIDETIVPVVEEAAGTVQSARKTLVSSQIVAAIREVRVAAGDTVAKDDVLIVLDDRELKAKASEAARAVEGTEAARAKLAADFERARRLQTEGIISRGEFDQARAAFDMAEADLARGRQAREGAEVGLSYAEIRSPVAGRVVDRLADPGDTALPGKPLLSVYDPRALRIEVPVRESLAIGLEVGASLQVRLGAGVDLLAGTVDEIVPQAEAGSRTFLVKVGLPAAEGIYSGMFGRVLIPAGQRKRLTVPEAAVVRIGQLTFVDVLGPERRVFRRLVTLGRPAGEGRLEVLSGLEGGEEVLLGSPPST